MIVTDSFVSKLRKEHPNWKGKLPTDEPGFPEEWEESDLKAWVAKESIGGVLKPPHQKEQVKAKGVVPPRYGIRAMVNNGHDHQPINGNGHRNAPPLANGGTGNMKNDSSLSAAADLIRTLDSAFSEMSSFAATAAKDAEDARRNARAASEFARKLSTNSSPKRSNDHGSPLILTVAPEKKPPFLPSTDSTATATNTTTDCRKETTPKHPVKPADSETKSEPPANPLENGHHSMEHTKRDGENCTHPSASGRKRKIKTSERLAQSHAEEVLSLSLEIERSKQALEKEQNSHHQTKAALKDVQSKNAQLEAQVQKLLHDMETQREDSGRKVDGLQHELNQAQIRVQAAEEDAELALDLAKGNAEEREQIETWLQRALQEVQVLREQLEHVGVSSDAVLPSVPEHSSSEPKSSSPKKTVVRFADSPTYPVEESAPVETPRSHPSKSMVAAGRTLLHRAAGVSTPETGDGKLHAISLTPEKSAERRNELRRRLQELGENDLEVPTPVGLTKSPSIHHGIDMGYATKAMEHCHNVVKLLSTSGKRLGLAGHWWTGNPKRASDDVNVEAMTRQFCQSVEVKIDRQREEAKELEALCEYFEQRLVSSKSPPPGRNT